MAVTHRVWLKEGSLGTACYDAATGEAELYLTDRIEGFYQAPGICRLRFAGRAFERHVPERRLRNRHRVYLAHHRNHSRKCADHRFGPKFECHLPWLGKNGSVSKNYCKSCGFTVK